MQSPTWFKNRVMFVINESDREAVRQAQRVLRLDETGELDPETRAHLAGFQSLFQLPQTGIIDEQTAIKLEQVRSAYT